MLLINSKKLFFCNLPRKDRKRNIPFIMSLRQKHEKNKEFFKKIHRKLQFIRVKFTFDELIVTDIDKRLIQFDAQLETAEQLIE